MDMVRAARVLRHQAGLNLARILTQRAQLAGLPVQSGFDTCLTGALI